MGVDADGAAGEAMEHLQNAAREVIKATRSMLDAAERLIEDPAAVQSVVSTFSTLAQAAASRLQSEAASSAADGPDDEDGSRVQRINLS